MLSLREHREAKGLTTKYVAKQLGIKVETLLAKERGERNWTTRELVKLAIIYDCKDITKISDIMN